MGIAEDTLYERLGGSPAIKATVAKLYGKILSDPILAPFFDGVDVERLRRSQAAFVGMAMGCSKPYEGVDLRKVHSHMNLNDSHFDAVALHLQSSLEELCIPNMLIREVMTIVESTRDQVLGK